MHLWGMYFAGVDSRMIVNLDHDDEFELIEALKHNRDIYRSIAILPNFFWPPIQKFPNRAIPLACIPGSLRMQYDVCSLRGLYIIDGD
jgi:hypothetical protein